MAQKSQGGKRKRMAVEEKKSTSKAKEKTGLPSQGCKNNSVPARV